MIYFIILLAIAIVALSWINGISYMHEKYPDYEGKDLFNDEEIKQDGKIQKDN